MCLLAICNIYSVSIAIWVYMSCVAYIYMDSYSMVKILNIIQWIISRKRNYIKFCRLDSMLLVYNGHKVGDRHVTWKSCDRLE